jgi:hypothetical protein
MRSILFIGVGILIHACTGKELNGNNYSVINEPKEYISKCGCGDRIFMKIATRYIEVPDTISRYGLVVLSQKIILHNDDIITEIENPMDRVESINIGKDSLSVKSTLFTGVKCLKSSKRVIYKVHGSDCIDPPHEFFGYLAPDGKWLYYYYGSQYEVYKKLGSDGYIKEEFGKESSSLKNMTAVLPGM